MKCRVFKKPDGGVIYSWPSKKYQDKPNFEGCKFPIETEGLPYIDLDETELHPSDSKTGDYHEMIHFDGACAKENFKQDKTWSKVLMPSFLIKEKHLSRLNQKIDQFLAQDVAEPLHLKEALKYLREKEKSQKWSDTEWHEQAIKNLDERVADGEPDKPIIRQKLLQKIQEN